jgi:predicted small secreted protein
MLQGVVMKKLAALIAVTFAFAVPLAGCNTFAGAGQDIQKGGEKLENAADRKK